jgi:ribonuclease D
MRPGALPSAKPMSYASGPGGATFRAENIATKQLASHAHLHYATAMTVVTTTSALEAACRRLAAHPFVTVDTEFLRETTFWPKVCLIQIASADEALAIDVLAPDLNLACFFDLMRDTAVVKVFHAARQDIEIIWKSAGIVPTPLFDTQVAAMVCGFGDQASYGELVQTICNVSLDKSSRFTDWARRPLSEAQVSYAIADVTHLRKIYLHLHAELERTGRLPWLADEMGTLTSPSTYEQHPENAWERFRSRVRKPRDLAVLMELAKWREEEAQARDVPRSRVLKDDALIEIVLAAPRTVEALGDLRAVPRGMDRSRQGADIVEGVERALNRDPKTLPRIERDRRGGGGACAATVELLKVLLRQVADAHGVAAKMIATVDDLEALTLSDKAEVPALHGWRRDLFGSKALELKRGNLALTVENGKVVVLEWQDSPVAG